MQGRFLFILVLHRLISLFNMLFVNNNINNLEKSEKAHQKSSRALRLLVVACVGLLALPLTNAAVVPLANVIVNSM
jgi:hypothetical protein